MRCSVTLLRKNGRRLPRSEWPEPLTGDLEMGWWEAETNSSKRNLRLLTLYDYYGTTRRTAALLFEPELIEIPPDGFLFAGYDLETVDKQVSEHRQLWLVRPG